MPGGAAVVTLDRRTLLVGGGVGVGLTLAFALWPHADGGALRPVRGGGLFDASLRIGHDGRLTFASPQVETGQGIWTALAMVAADELGAAWETVAVVTAPAGTGPMINPAVVAATGQSARVTAGSSSLAAFEPVVRRAAATARAMLCAEAASRWGIGAADCATIGGVVAGGGHRLPFAALAEAAALRSPPADAPLRPGGSGAIAGNPLARLDLPAKMAGRLRFAGDVRLPQMLFASVRLAPPGGRVLGLDSAPAAAHIERGDTWVAALAETWWAANRALAAIHPRFDGPAHADSAAINEALARQLDQGPFALLASRGDYAGAVAGSRPLAATYALAARPGIALEPPSATAEWQHGRLALWAGCRAPDLVRQSVAAALGLDPATIDLYPTALGGQHGALGNLAAPIAAELARRSGRPVQLVVPATEAQNHLPLAPPLVARMTALPDPAAGLAAWRTRIVTCGGIERELAALAGGDTGFAPAGFVPPYAIGALRVEAADAQLKLATGYSRGGWGEAAGFIAECFVDELARAAGADPLSYRMALLSGAPRLARVLADAAQRGGWDGGQRGSSLGIACWSIGGSHIGLLAEAVIGEDQRVAVSRLVASVDCGRAVNPGLVRQQVESGLVDALAMATMAEPELVAAMPRARALAALRPPSLAAVPKVEVTLLESGEAPGGVSGLAASVVAAAVANALFAASGKRLRRVPFDPMSAG